MTEGASPAVALSLRDLRVRFGARTALDGVSLDVRAGEFVALAGPNGSGKSTLLRVALGLLAPDGGTATLFGEEVGRLSFRERARRVAWVPQEEAPRDNVELVRYVLYGRYPHLGPFEGEAPEDRRRALEVLRQVGLADRAHDGILEISGGERQRTLLARALAQEAPLLLLDEPTAHLDIGHQLDLLVRVRALASGRGLAVVAAIHDLNLAARFADRVAVLSRGRVVADGPPAAVLSPGLLRTVWGIAADLRQDRRTGIPYLVTRLATEPPERPSPGAPAGRVHVVGGGGAAAPILGRLHDAGYLVSLGAVPLLDTDAEAAELLGLPVALEAPFAPLSEEVRARHRTLLAEADAVVVAPFAVGPSNLANLEDVAALPGARRVLLVAAPDEAALDFTGGQATALRGRLRDRGAETVPEEELLAALRRDRGPRPDALSGGVAAAATATAPR